MDNDNYNDNYYEEFEKKKHGTVYRILSWALCIFVIAFAIFLYARIRINNHAPTEVEATVWDSEAYSAYASSPDTFEIYSYTLESYYTDNPDNPERITRNIMTKNLNVKFTAMEYMKNANELQFTVRYNEATANEYAIDGEGEPFVYILRDDKGNLYSEYSYKGYEQNFMGSKRYNYRRLVYKNIEVEDIGTLTMYVYSAGSAVTDESHIDAIIIYDAYLPLTKKDFTPPSGAQTLTPAPVTVSNNEE